jgi:hypothetical protein
LSSFQFFVTTKGDSVMGVALFDALRGVVQVDDAHFVSQPTVAGVTSSLTLPVEPMLSSVLLADYRYVYCSRLSKADMITSRVGPFSVTQPNSTHGKLKNLDPTHGQLCLQRHLK